MKSIFAVAAATFLAAAPLLAAPAFAAGDYQTSPTLAVNARTPSLDTGSAQMPQFDGVAAATTSGEEIRMPNASEASVESVNSEPVALHFGR